MALGLAACGTDPTTVDYFGMTYDELQSSMEQEVSALVGLTDDNRTYIQSYGSDTAMKLVESWDEATRCRRISGTWRIQYHKGTENLNK